MHPAYLLGSKLAFRETFARSNLRVKDKTDLDALRRLARNTDAIDEWGEMMVPFDMELARKMNNYLRA